MGSKKKSSIILKVVLAIVLIGGAVGAYYGNLYYQNFLVSNVVAPEKGTYLFIPRNATTQDVVELLKTKDLLKDVATFEWLVEKKNYKGKNIVPGKYKIENGWSNNRLVDHLRAGNGLLDVKITFNQLRDLKQLSGALSKEIEPDSVAIYQWLTNNDSIGRYGFNKHTIISMFIPNTYFVSWDISVPELMSRMAKEYKGFWTEERKQKARTCKLTQSEVTTLASIVYWETKLKADMPVIAGVYMNRIRLGMPLQADPTLIFAMGDYSIRRVLKKHKEINSPFNTYKYKGLPPGPIIIPPTTYIDAVLNYQKHKYLYFVAKEDFSGASYFASNYKQHLVYARRYQNALNKRKVYR